MTRPPLVVIPQYFGSLVFDRRTSRYLAFDAETTAILTALAPPAADADAAGADAHRRALAIADVIASRTFERERDAVWAFCDYFERKGFFTVGGRLAGVVLPAEPPPDHLLGPLAVHLEVIAACNLTCTHCFAGALPRNTSPLSVAEMDALFAQLARLGSYRLGLTGGEPLLRRDILDIMDAATDRGLHPCITTNGLCITDELARELGRRELVWLNVSLDGARAATNDAIRGAGTFARVREKLRVLARHARFTLAFTITSTNAGEVEACARLARDVGAHTAVFRPLYPTGVALAHMHLLPSYDQYADALDRLAHTPTTPAATPDAPRESVAGAATLHAIDPFSPQARERARARVHTNRGCGAGNTVASISVQGEVNPCSFLGSAHDAGNIRERPFADIWREAAAFRHMRRDLGDDGFSGGCRARSLALAGDVDAPDPWQAAWEARVSGVRTSPDQPPSARARGARLPLYPTCNLELEPR